MTLETASSPTIEQTATTASENITSLFQRGTLKTSVVFWDSIPSTSARG